MDRENIIAIKELLDKMLGDECEKMPTDEELNYDDDWIDMYACLRSLKESIENCGF